MSKSQKSNKEAKKPASMSMKEKRTAKHLRKHVAETPPLIVKTA